MQNYYSDNIQPIQKSFPTKNLMKWCFLWQLIILYCWLTEHQLIKFLVNHIVRCIYI